MSDTLDTGGPVAGRPLFAMAGVSVTFGGVSALDQVSLDVPDGEVVGVIGPNGAGKTTLFNVACGLVRPDRGTLTHDGRRLGRLRPQQLARLGIGRTLQGLGLFDTMSVLDNVMVGAGVHARSGFWSDLLGLRRGTRDDAALRERSRDVLDELGIGEHRDARPASLPYAVRKRVALARALVAQPRLLLLDEPASGLSDREMDELGEVITSLRGRMSVLLVEHHMDLVMGVCDQLVVLDFGRVIARGLPEQVQQDPAVLEAYLGDEVAADPDPAGGR